MQVHDRRINPDHEKHGAGFEEEVPHITSPEEWADRHTHDRAAKFCFLMEQQMLVVEPTHTEALTFLVLNINMVINGRTTAEVVRRYKDVGWAQVQLVVKQGEVPPGSGDEPEDYTMVNLQFP